MARINPKQAEEWLTRINENIKEFRKKPRLNLQDKQKFLNQQYQLLHLIARALDDKVQFVGISPPKDV